MLDGSRSLSLVSDGNEADFCSYTQFFSNSRNEVCSLSGGAESAMGPTLFSVVPVMGSCDCSQPHVSQAVGGTALLPWAA